MKHSDFYKERQEMRHRIYKELIAALEAHGGSYTWGEENEEEEIDVDTDECPIVDVVPRCWQDVTAVYIAKATYREGHLEFVAYAKDYMDEVNIDLEDITTDSLEYIIEYIPETDTVFDVSIPHN